MGRIQLWGGFSPLRPLQVQFITDESTWGGSNYGEGSVRSGRSRYSLSLRACGADPTMARVQSALAAPGIQAINFDFRNHLPPDKNNALLTIIFNVHGDIVIVPREISFIFFLQEKFS